MSTEHDASVLKRKVNIIPESASYNVCGVKKVISEYIQINDKVRNYVDQMNYWIYKVICYGKSKIKHVMQAVHVSLYHIQIFEGPEWQFI